MMDESTRNEIADKINDELTEWANLHGYETEWDTFLDTAFDYAYSDSIDEPSDVDFLDALELAQGNGIFDDLTMNTDENGFLKVA